MTQNAANVTHLYVTFAGQETSIRLAQVKPVWAIAPASSITSALLRALVPPHRDQSEALRFTWTLAKVTT